jgi:hypothetical protein
LIDCPSQSYYFYKYSIKDGKRFLKKLPTKFNLKNKNVFEQNCCRKKITIEEERVFASSVYFLKRSYISKISIFSSKCISTVSK